MSNNTENRKLTKKDFIYLGILLTILFVATIVLTIQNNEITKLTKYPIEQIDSTSKTDTIKCATYKFEFDGHKYIKFKTADDEYYIHDPACRCNVNRLNNITTVIMNNDNSNIRKIEKKLDVIDVHLNEVEKIAKSPKIITKTRIVYITKPIKKKKR